jgi:prepilin signal peptidase PulO-like enzyme (type II secretory pathway)
MKLFLQVLLAVNLASIVILDGWKRKIPDVLLLCYLGIGSVSSILFATISMQERIFASFLFGGAFLFFALTPLRGFGGGDIKLMMCVAFVNGFLISCKVACLAIYSAAVYSMIQGIRNRSLGKKRRTIAFAPFVVIGIVLAT